MMKILVTGVAGFIGYHLSNKLLSLGYRIYGIDNLNNYYDVSLKQARLSQLLSQGRFTFEYLDISDRHAVANLFLAHKFDCVINLAAQAGVRYSLQNPHAYVDSNLVGFTNILEGCRHSQIKHLLFASSSSVYGANTKVPFSPQDNVDRPVSLYAATKKANELMAHSYSHLYNIPTTGLRFFTVYGSWGRPDMAYFKFTKAIAEGRAIDVYNYGKMKRDFTHIDDIVEAIVRIIPRPPNSNRDRQVTEEISPKFGIARELAPDCPPYKIYNLGNNKPIELREFIGAIENALGKKAKQNFLPMQPGDVVSTYADIDELIADFAFKPSTSVEKGIQQFVSWYLQYYGGTSSNSRLIYSLN